MWVSVPAAPGKGDSMRKTVHFYRNSDESSVALVVIDLKATKREIMASFLAGLEKLRPKPVIKTPSPARRRSGKNA